jgi:hypothetical protein
VALLLGLLLPTAGAELVQQGRLRVAVDASLAPKRLPRSGLAPVRFAFSARFIESQDEIPPQLRQIRIEINRHGRLDPSGLPSCRIDQIQPATTTNALRACRSSLVGEGHFSSRVLFPRQAPFPSDGKLVAFNGRWHGRPAILAHIYGPKPVPTSYTIPFVISSTGAGTFGTRLNASLPAFSNKWGYVTAISISLGRHFSYRGRSRSYLSAGCPAPSGISVVNFPLSRTSFAFRGHGKVNSTLIRSCRAAR